MTLYSPFFLLAFLPLSAAIYTALKGRAKTAALCIASTLFYIFAAGRMFYLLPLLVPIVYALSFLGKKGAYICLAFLPLLRLCGVFAVGLSFFILRAVSYIYDGHREKNILKVFAYLMFFPCVLAGPLTRYAKTERAFDNPVPYSFVSRGILLTVFGGVKKLFFADALFAAYELFFFGQSALSALFALISYSLYIYFDFSGCSDMARGIALIFGFEVPQNFDFPYMSKSVCEFFRRWHITLGRWLFDYVYLPLGGSKCGKVKTVISFFAVWLFSSLWHGSTLSYLLWGAYFFLICTAEKLFLKKGQKSGIFFTLLAVNFGWVLFFSKTPRDTIAFFYRLFAMGNTLLYSRADLYNCMRYVPLILLSILFATPIVHSLCAMIYKRVPALLYFAAPLVFFFLLSCLVANTHTPFLYATF